MVEDSELIPTFSPQGDGNRPDYPTVKLEVEAVVDPYLFPARGRKRLLFSPLLLKSGLMLIPTFSPQGDGNSLLYIRSA